ncbi:GNAT family N-acetyltransferase [Flavobacterium sp. DGU11]|uniref:GNAT family N-acetyltransferase n=1 Tax=Flavobacterium arundinis TaxID=3139143 RepID=A0ABU9HS96_9FLAO
MTIERAIPSDHTTLTVITKQSKAYWGYSTEQMEDWNALLTITPDYLANNEAWKLVSGGEIIGYYSIFEIDPQSLKLDNLFILPEFIGKGLGKKLMDNVFEKAALNNYSSITLDADPNAESFYHHFGFVTIGQIETSVPNRFLPVMRKLL